MPRSQLKSLVQRGNTLFPILVWLVVCAGVTSAQVGLAQRTLAEADKLRTEWKSESFKLAARKYTRVQGLFHVSGELRLEAETLEKLGDVSSLLSDYQSAIAHYNQALPLAVSLKDERLEAVVLTKLGGAYLEMANVKKASPQCSRSLEISERLGFEEGTALALNCLGVASQIASDVSQAQEHFERALTIAQKIKVPSVLALTQLNLGYLHSNLGNTELALSSYKAALEIGPFFYGPKWPQHCLGPPRSNKIFGWAEWLISRPATNWSQYIF